MANLTLWGLILTSSPLMGEELGEGEMRTGRPAQNEPRPAPCRKGRAGIRPQTYPILTVTVAFVVIPALMALRV